MWAYGGGFGTLWGDSELTLGSSVAYGDDFGMVIVSSWVYKSYFFKNISFPSELMILCIFSIDFQSFYTSVASICDYFGSTFVSQWSYFEYMRVTYDVS